MEFLAKYKLVVAAAVGLLTLLAVLFVLSRMYFTRAKGVPFFRTRPDFSISTEGVKKVVLDNGMTLLVFKNPTVPKVLVQIAYNVGSYVEDAGERGLAHLIEHMIFKGTQKLAETDIDVIARKFGASFNAFTSMDVTSYYFETNKNNWKPFLEILSDCMQNARFDSQHLASEIKTVIQELKMYKDDYWQMMFQKIVSLLFPANHPYHYPVIGFKEDLLNLSAENLKKFYDKYYTPDRATLFVVGDIDIDEVVEHVKKRFEPITADHKASVADFPHVPQELLSQHTRFYEDIKSEQLAFYWRIPGMKDKDELLASATAFLLGAGEGSRLHRALVDEHKVASSVGVYAQKFMEAGVFIILIEPVGGKSEACKKIISQELEKAVKEGFRAKELEHMTKTKGKRFLQKLQQFKNFTYEWLTSYFATNNELEIFNRVNRYVSIESNHVQNFVKEHLDPLLMNQIEALPIPESKKVISEQAKRHSDELDKLIMAKYNRTVPIEEPKYVHEIGQPQPLDFTFPKPDKSFTLNNGLKVFLRKQGSFPLISMNCKFKEFFYFSSAKEGLLVDLMMNMLMEGSKGYTKKDNVDFFEFHGADYRFSAAGGGLSLLSTDYATLFERFLHVLHYPSFPHDALEKLKNITVDSFTRSKDDPVERGIRMLKSKIYKDHPFSWSFDDAISLSRSITTKDLQALHKKYLVPVNMILTVVGNFDLDEMEKNIRAIFEPWRTGVEHKVDYPKSTFVPRVLEDVYMVRDQVVLLLGQPSPITIYHDDAVPLKLLNYIGFHSLGSRLFKLRERSGLFYTAFGSWAAGAGKDIGFDYLGAILSLENLDKAEQQMRQLAKDIAAKGVDEQEVAAARQLYLKSLIDAVSNNASVADLLSTLEAFQLGMDYYDKVLKRVQTMSIDELNGIASNYFNTDKMVRIRVGRIGK